MKNLNQHIINIIIAHRGTRNRRNIRPYNNFATKIFLAKDLLQAIEESISKNDLITEGRKNCIISCITSLEVYLRELFFVVFRLCPPEPFLTRCSDLINISLNFNDLINLTVNRVSPQELLTHCLSFQNLKSVNRAYSTLIGKDFFNALKNREFKSLIAKPIPFKLDQDYTEKLDKLFQLRHNIVHDVDFALNIDKIQLEDYISNLLLFVVAVDIYMHREIIEPNLKDELKGPKHSTLKS